MSRVNYQRMVAAHRRMRAALPAARVAMVRGMVSQIIGTAARIAPRDTNRYVRGWIVAGKMVGVTDVPLPVIRESKYSKEYIARLIEQQQKFEAQVARVDGLIYAWYDKPGRRRRGYYNRLLAERTRWQQRADRAREETEKFIRATGAIVIGVGVNVVGGKVTGSLVRGGGRKISVTVRDRVHGGRGRVIMSDGRCVIILHNMEPHARIVEAKRSVLRTAEAGARLAGLRRLGAGYRKAIVIAAGTTAAQKR